jgi:hypothetical protein
MVSIELLKNYLEEYGMISNQHINPQKENIQINKILKMHQYGD